MPPSRERGSWFSRILEGESEGRRWPPDGRDDARIGDGFIAGETAPLPHEGLGDEDPVVPLGDLGSSLKAEGGHQSKGDDTEVVEGADAADDLPNVGPDSSAFDGKNTLRQDDHREDDLCPAGHRLCEGASRKRAQAGWGSQVPDQATKPASPGGASRSAWQRPGLCR